MKLKGLELRQGMLSSEAHINLLTLGDKLVNMTRTSIYIGIKQNIF